MTVKNKKIKPGKNVKKVKNKRGCRNGPVLSIEDIARAIEASGGFLSYAAKALNVSPAAITHRVKKSKKLQDKLIEVKNGLLDFAEHALIKKIKHEDLGAICFYLKCQGKHRGYVEKQQLEHSGPEGGPVAIKTKYTTKELKEEMIKRGLPIPDIE